MQKAAIRATFLQQRKALDADTKGFLTENITTHLMDFLKGKSIKYIMSYVSMEHKGEIDTSIMEQAIIAQFPSIQILYPKVIGNHMEAVLPMDRTDWSTSALGVKEYNNYEIVNASEVDIILVPLLAIDINGFRVGYGKGFYDAFIPKTQAITIGLSLFDAIAPIEDLRKEDVPLQYGLFPQGLIAYS